MTEDGRPQPRGADRRLRELGARVASRASSPAGQALAEPKPLFRKLDRSSRRGRARAGHDRHPRAPRARRGAGGPRTGPSRRCRPGDRRRDDDRGSPPGTRARRRVTTGVYASLGIHPHEAGGATTAGRLDELARLLRRSGAAVAVGETGLDYFRDYAPRDAQRRLFDAQLALAADLGKPVVIHTSEPRTPTRSRALAGFRGHRRPALLLRRRPCSSLRSSAAGTSRSRATSPTRRRPSCARRPHASRHEPPARRDRQPLPRAPAGTRRPQRARLRRPHARRARGGTRRGSAASSQRQIDANATAAFGL